MDEGDQGLFGPATVTWQLHADPMMWVAGVRALYLQALHPRAVRGVMQNSDFREDAWGRLRRTADFVGTVTYGTTAAAEKAGARVRKIHRLLKATDPVTGETYGIDEPGLLLWVHCAEIDSYLQVLRRSGLPLTGAQADRYIGEQRAGARLVGLGPDGVPADTAALAAYFEEVGPELAATPEAVMATSTTFSVTRRFMPCCSRRAHCCGGAWRHSPTTHCLRTPTPCTAGRHPPPRRSTVACVLPEPCCAAFPPACAGNSRPGTSRRRWRDSVPEAAPPRTNSAGWQPYWTSRGGRSGRRSDGGDSRRWRRPG